MRIVPALALVLVLFRFTSPAMAECIGSGIGTVCINPFTGSVKTAADRYIQQSGAFANAGSQGSKIGKFPSASAGSRNTAPAAGSGGSGVTAVLQPTAQSANAEVLTPQSGGGAVVQSGGSAGATVLGNGDNAAVVCGLDTAC